GSVAPADLVACRHEVVSAAAVLETQVRTGGDRHLRALVSALLLEFARFGRAHGGAGLAVDHTTVWRWTQAYGPEVYRRLHGQLKRSSSTWHIDETNVRIGGKWMYLFRAVDSHV